MLRVPLILVLITIFPCLVGCSALRYAGHLAEVPWGESLGTSVVPVPGTPVEERWIVDVIAIPREPVPEAPSPQTAEVPPIVVDMPAPYPNEIPVDVPPPTGPPTDITALSLQCRKELRPELVETTSTMSSFGTVEKLVYGLVMIFDAAVVTGIALSFSKSLKDDQVSAIVFGSMFAVDFVGWALLVAFMPRHEHTSVGIGPGRWQSAIAPCPQNIVVQQGSRRIPVVDYKNYLVLDDEYVVGELVRGDVFQVTLEGYPGVQTIAPSTEEVCRWAADDQKSARCQGNMSSYRTVGVFAVPKTQGPPVSRGSFAP